MVVKDMDYDFLKSNGLIRLLALEQDDENSG